MVLLLDRFRSHDIRTLRTVVTQPLARDAGLPWPFDARSHVAAAAGRAVYAIRVDGPADLAGCIEVKVDGEVAYWVAEARRRRGIATAALKELIAAAPEPLFFARIAADNAASRRVAEKVGLPYALAGRAPVTLIEAA